MSILQQTIDTQLRLGIGITGYDSRVQSGVIRISDIPAGAVLFITVDRPTELGEESLTVSDTQPYKIEHAAPPNAFTEGGFSFRNQRVLIGVGNGGLRVHQEEPSWSSFGTGSLRQKGRTTHSFTMPGTTGTTPNLAPANRHILRIRWTATAVSAEVLAAADGTTKVYSGSFAGKNIAPGSMTFHATVATVSKTYHDDGQGHVVGNGVDGVVDYVQGTFRLVFSNGAGGGAPDAASNITADYEKDCKYRPLDFKIQFDTNAQ